MWMVEIDETVTRDKLGEQRCWQEWQLEKKLQRRKKEHRTKQGGDNNTQRKSVPKRLEKTESRALEQNKETAFRRKWREEVEEWAMADIDRVRL